MTTKAEVIETHLAFPKWTAQQIATKLGCGASYVRKTAARCNIDLPRKLDHDIASMRQRAAKHRQIADSLTSRADMLEAGQ